MRRFLVVVLAGALVGMGLASSPRPAEALSAGVAFTADNAPTWQTNGTVWALAGAGSAVFAGGTFTQIRPPSGGSGTTRNQTSLASFNAATGQPGTCLPNVTLSGGTSTVRALTLSPDGRTLYIGGNFSNVGGVTVARLAALDLATCTVTSFRTPLISSMVRGLAVTSTTVYAAGEFQSVGGQTRRYFAAFDARTGALLPWTADADGFGKAVAVAADGQTVAIGGDFFNVNGQYSHSIAIVDPTTGALMRTYPAGFIPNTSVTQAITTDATSYYVANQGSGGGVFDGKFAIAYSDLNQRWRDTCLGATQAVLVDGGTLYSAHHHHDCSSMGGFPDGMRTYLSAERTSDAFMLGWRPTLNDGIGEGIGPRALALATVGSVRYLWVGGEFTLTNGASQQGLTRFPSSPDTGNPPVPSPVTPESLTTGSVLVRWRTVFDADDGSLTYRVYRDGVQIGVVTAESRWWLRPQASFVDGTALPGRTYGYRVSASDGTNTSALSAAVSVTVASRDVSYASRVLHDGAQLYWRYDEASGRYGSDSSTGNRNPQFMVDPVYRAAANVVTGEPGYAMDFGAGAYAYSDAWAQAPNVYSVETWFRTTTAQGGKIIGYGTGQPTNHNPPRNPLSRTFDRHVYMLNDGRLAFGVRAESAFVIRSTASYNDGAWHHVVATQGPDGIRLFVDGHQVASDAAVTTGQAYVGSWRTGGDSLTGWPDRPTSNFFDGLIDETAVYPTVLTPVQVADHYQIGSGTSPADTTAPSSPTDLAAVATGPDVGLGWTASTDDVGVASYAVHRSDQDGFTVSDATRIATVTGTTYVDPARPGGTWYYRVVAVDAAGNASVASEQASATVSVPPVATTLTLAPTADAYVNESLPTTNYGSLNQLFSRAPSPTLASYLAFDLPAAPSGTVLSAARLVLRTTTASTSGSTGSHTVSLASGGWSESTVTFASRPTTGDLLGTLPAGAVPSTTYTIDLDASRLVSSLGGSVSLVLGSSSATDTLLVWSREYTTATQRPSLVLDFAVAP